MSVNLYSAIYQRPSLSPILKPPHSPLKLLLTTPLQNNASLNQLPYNGKKTRPAALRKDHWHPLAHITFPPGASSSGLSAFQKLREYRRRHELSWDPSSPLFKRVPEIGETELQKSNTHLPNKLRARKLNDQKANTVADMAAVLREIRNGNKKIGLEGIGPEGVVEVRWSNLSDASYAGEGVSIWGDAVLHGTLPWDRNNRDVLMKKALRAEKKAERKAVIAAYEAQKRERKQKNRDEASAQHVALLKENQAKGKGAKTMPEQTRERLNENWALERQAKLEKLAWMHRNGWTEEEYQKFLEGGKKKTVDVVQTQDLRLESEAEAEAQAQAQAETETETEISAEPLGLDEDSKDKTDTPASKIL